MNLLTTSFSKQAIDTLYYAWRTDVTAATKAGTFTPAKARYNEIGGEIMYALKAIEKTQISYTAIIYDEAQAAFIWSILERVKKQRTAEKAPRPELLALTILAKRFEDILVQAKRHLDVDGYKN